MSEPAQLATMVEGTRATTDIGEPIVLVRPWYPIWGNLKDQPRVALAFTVVLLLVGLISPLFWHSRGWALVFYAGLVVFEALAVGATVMAIRSARRRASVAIFADRLVQVRWNGRTQEVTRATIAGAARLRIAPHGRLPEGMRMRYDLLLLLDAGNRCLLRFRPTYFQPGDMERVLAALAVPVLDEARTLATPTAIAQRYPGAFPSWQAHPLRLILLITVPLTLLAVIAGLAARHR